MKMITSILLSALVLSGCNSMSRAAPDFFAGQTAFAAAREREVIVFEQLDYDRACAHVTEVLLDLDCQLQEANADLGVFTGASQLRMINPESFIGMPSFWSSCSGHQVTVTVDKRVDGAVAIRASFAPSNAVVDQTFRTLLRNSVALDRN
jgi:hypothetical protein